MFKLVEDINFEPLLKAQALFEAFRQNMVTEQSEAGAILAFGCTYNFAWQTMRGLVFFYGLEAYSPSEVFRTMAIDIGLIKSPEPWFQFMHAYDLRLEAYDDKNVAAILAVFDDFSRELSLFLDTVKADINTASLFAHIE